MVLHEFSDLADVKALPKRRKYLAYYLAGFADGEGCFSISVKRQNDTKFGWVVDPVFHVTQHKDNRLVLELFRRMLQCGRIISKPGQENLLQYVVDNRRQLKEKVIPFFRKHRLLAKAKAFSFFAEVVENLEKGAHRKASSFKELIRNVYEHSADRKHELDGILKEIDERVDASETIRRAPQSQPSA